MDGRKKKPPAAAVVAVAGAAAAVVGVVCRRRVERAARRGRDGKQVSGGRQVGRGDARYIYYICARIQT